MLIFVFYDRHFKNANSNNLIKNCDGFQSVSVLILGTNPDDTAECLLSLLHNSKCPKAYKILLVESVDQYQEESASIQKYKKISTFKGRYNYDFIDQIQVHQIKSKCLFADAMHLLPIDKKMTIISPGHTLYLNDWDLSLYEQFEFLESASFGGLFLGSSGNSAAYTGIGTFRTIKNPIISLRPIWKPGNVKITWPSYPLLIKTSILKRCQSCSVYESQFELALSNYSFYTTKDPIATIGPIEADANIYLPELFYEKHKLLGLEKNANALEIISKFGSISAYQWSLSE